MKLLIIGGGGLIGQAITKKHLEEGDEVYIWDVHANPYIDYSTNVGIDLSDEPLLIALASHDFDLISNQAALVSVGKSQYEIGQFTSFNITMYAYWLDDMVKLKKFPKRILHAGSMGPYGKGEYPFATSEDDLLEPESIYGVTKLAQEKLLRVFANTYEVPSISLRYFSVYSVEQNPLNPLTGVLSIIANQIINNDKIELYDDGGQTRDLIEVKDVADAHFIASRVKLHDYFTAVNVGTGFSKPLNYIAKKMRDILSPDKKIVFNGLTRKGDIRHMYACTYFMQDFLNFWPKTKIDDGIVEYCEFIKKNWDKFKVGNTVKEENERIKKMGLINEV